MQNLVRTSKIIIIKIVNKGFVKFLSRFPPGFGSCGGLALPLVPFQGTKGGADPRQHGGGQQKRRREKPDGGPGTRCTSQQSKDLVGIRV